MTTPTSIRATIVAGAVASVLSTPVAAQTESEAIASNFGLAVDLCLQHVRDRNPVDSFRAAGFEVRAADEGTFEFSTLGVSGWLAQGVSGPPERGYVMEIAPEANCSALNVLHANRITTLVVTNVPHWEGCDSPDSGAVFFN